MAEVMMASAFVYIKGVSAIDMTEKKKKIQIV